MTWHGWEVLGGELLGSPAVASWAPGRLDVVAIGNDRELYHKWHSDGWSHWESLDGELIDGPGMAAWSENRSTSSPATSTTS